MIGTHKNNLPQNLLLNKRQVASLRKALASSTLKDVKLSKTQNNTVRWFPRQTSWTITENSPAINENVLKPLAKKVQISLGLTAAASPADARISKKILGS